MTVKNPIAKIVRSALFRAKIVKTKKGKGSYCRKKEKRNDVQRMA